MQDLFTGIIEQTGEIVESRVVPGGRRLRIQAGDVARDCQRGASICVSGVCLTVVEARNGSLEFDVIQETLARSSLGVKQAGDFVNLERSLRVGDRLDGHFVQGHVDGTATVTRVEATSREHVVWFKPQDALMPYVVPKGSIALDGVSLTIASGNRGQFSVALIPTTLERTTLGSLRAGHIVNVESDIIVRTIIHRLLDLGMALNTRGPKSVACRETDDSTLLRGESWRVENVSPEEAGLS